MAINSREKGKRREREFRDLLRKHGHTAHRGQQYSGEQGNPDVVCKTTPDIHWEVKGRESGSMYDWLYQAEKDSGGKFPIVAHKKNGRQWVIIIMADTFLKFYNEHIQKETQKDPGD